MRCEDAASIERMARGMRAFRRLFYPHILRILTILNFISESAVVRDDSAGVEDFMLPVGQHFAASDLLLIGSKATLDGLVAGFCNTRSLRPRTYFSYTMPPTTLLACAAAVFIYEVECHERYEQLRGVCEYQRSYGGIKLILGFSRCLDAGLAARVLESGAIFCPQ